MFSACETYSFPPEFLAFFDSSDDDHMLEMLNPLASSSGDLTTGVYLPLFLFFPPTVAGRGQSAINFRRVGFAACALAPLAFLVANQTKAACGSASRCQ